MAPFFNAKNASKFKAKLRFYDKIRTWKPEWKEISGITQSICLQYYTKDTPSVSDSEYDQLYRELVELETAHPDEILPEVLLTV